MITHEINHTTLSTSPPNEHSGSSQCFITLSHNGKHALSSSTPGLKIGGVKVKSYVKRHGDRSWIVSKNIVYVVRGTVKNAEKLKRNKVKKKCEDV